MGDFAARLRSLPGWVYVLTTILAAARNYRSRPGMSTIEPPGPCEWLSMAFKKAKLGWVTFSAACEPSWERPRRLRQLLTSWHESFISYSPPTSPMTKVSLPNVNKHPAHVCKPSSPRKPELSASNLSRPSVLNRGVCSLGDEPEGLAMLGSERQRASGREVKFGGIPRFIPAH